MTPSFFRKARRPQGAVLTIGAQPVTVRVKPVVTDETGAEVTGTCDDDALTIELKDQPIPLMRDTLFHELFHAAMRVYRLSGCLKGRSDKTRLESEERIAHTLVPALLGALDQCK